MVRGELDVGLKSEEDASALRAESPSSGLLWSLSDWLLFCIQTKIEMGEDILSLLIG